MAKRNKTDREIDKENELQKLRLKMVALTNEIILFDLRFSRKGQHSEDLLTEEMMDYVIEKLGE